MQLCFMLILQYSSVIRVCVSQCTQRENDNDNVSARIRGETDRSSAEVKTGSDRLPDIGLSR
jgi:hypothetical protein